MKFITLPSGIIVNLEQVAYISPSRGVVKLFFPATHSTERPPAPMTLELKSQDARVFLAELEPFGVSPKYALAALKD